MKDIYLEVSKDKARWLYGKGATIYIANSKCRLVPHRYIWGNFDKYVSKFVREETHSPEFPVFYVERRHYQ
jgi:hypothetical protein